MDIAKISEINEIISNIDLSLMNETLINELHYECPECNISLSPASYRPHNIKSPYFTPANKKIITIKTVYITKIKTTLKNTKQQIITQ